MINELATAAEKILHVSLDRHRYLTLGNAFGKRAVFLYKRGAQEPSYVTRIPLSDVGIEQCEIEYLNLQRLVSLAPPGIDFPKPVARFTFADRTCFVQTAVHAVPLLNIVPLGKLGRPNQNEFYWLTDALIRLYWATRSKGPGGPCRSLCFQHGDFWAGNLARRDDTLVMHDLEFGNPSGRPLYDLLHFGLHFQIVLSNIGKVKLKIFRRGDKALIDDRIEEPDTDTVYRSLLNQSPLAKLMRKCIQRYIRGCAIEKREALHLAISFLQDDRGISSLNIAEIETTLKRI